jgi:hypothetical protein
MAAERAAGVPVYSIAPMQPEARPNVPRPAASGYFQLYSGQSAGR